MGYSGHTYREDAGSRAKPLANEGQREKVPLHTASVTCKLISSVRAVMNEIWLSFGATAAQINYSVRSQSGSSGLITDKRVKQLHKWIFKLHFNTSNIPDSMLRFSTFSLNWPFFPPSAIWIHSVLFLTANTLVHWRSLYYSDPSSIGFPRFSNILISFITSSVFLPSGTNTARVSATCTTVNPGKERFSMNLERKLSLFSIKSLISQGSKLWCVQGHSQAPRAGCPLRYKKGSTQVRDYMSTKWPLVT